MPRSRSIRQRLFVNLLLVIFILGGSIFVLTVSGSRTAVRTLSEALITRAIDSVRARLDGFFRPVEDELMMARSWGADGVLDRADPAALDRLLEPLIVHNPQLSSLLIADGRGEEYMLLRTADGWTRRLTAADGDGAALRSTEWAWTDESPTPVPARVRDDYDPRRRPWFEGAVRRRDELGAAADAAPRSAIHWTEPYTFFTTEEAGITVSTTFDGGDGVDHVVGFDMLLRDISKFSGALDVSPHGLVFVLSEDFEFIGLPAGNIWADEKVRADHLLAHPDDIDLPLARDANAALIASAGDLEPKRFRSEGVPWWGCAVQYPLAGERTLWISVILPEADLLGTLTTLRVWIVAVTLVVLAIALVRAVFLAARYSRPIELLVHETDRMSRGDLEPGPPVVSDVTEVRRLAAAHERMRVGLRSLMKLERDLQLARQIQQSTFPESLPDLPGFEIAASSEPAEETGGDTYDVIGYVYDVVYGTTGDAGRDGGDANRNDDRAVLLLADATGHGIGPALSVTQIRAMLRMAVRMGEDLASIALHMNEQLCADLPEERFITAWLAELNADDHTLRTYSAGQGPLLLHRAKENETIAMNANAPPFGIVPDLTIDIPAPIPLWPGDLFAVISDGFFEAADPQGNQFGLDAVKRLLAEHRRLPAQGIIDILSDAVAAFTNGAPADDDRTAIVIKRV